MFHATTPSRNLRLQRKCACGGVAGPDGECEACRKKRESGRWPAPKEQAAKSFPAESRFAQDFSQLRLHPEGNGPALQRKLTIGATDDPLECEADRVADQVTASQNAPASRAAPLRLQRVVQLPAAGAENAPPSVVRALEASGRTLENSVRVKMEQRFGHDFSRVRIHHSSAAAESARDVNAQAYTVGSNIVFGAGAFAPGTLGGRRLIAHELAHVVQQTGAAPVQPARSTPVLPAPLAPRAPVPRVQRKQETSHPRDRCENVSIPANSCATSSTASQLAKLSPYLAKAGDNMGGRSLNAVSGILTRAMSSVERANLLRIACCQLLPDDAQTVLESFSGRHGTGGRRFGEFATATRCELLAILQRQMAVVVKPVAAATIADAIRAEFGPGVARGRRETAARVAFKASSGFNLRDPAVLKLAADTVRELAGENVMIVYLTLVDQSLPAREQTLAQDPFAVMKVKRRGPYGTYFGAGISVMVGPFHFLAAFAANVKAFIRGLRNGVSESVSEEAAVAFGERLASSVVLALVFPVPFLAGTAVGLWDMVKGFVETIVNIKEVVETMVDLFRTMFSPKGYDFAKAMGHGMGVEFGKTVVSMSKLGLVSFAYELGKLIGPAILMFVLTLLGVPGLAAAAFSARLAQILGPVVRKFPRFARLIGKTRAGAKVEADIAVAAKAERRLGKEATAAEVAELALARKSAADAVQIIERNPRSIKGKPGHREAPATPGHKVVEVADPSLPDGIGCEYHSPPPFVRVPCPKGMGTRETVEQFKARGGEVREIDAKPNPKSEAQVTAVREPELPAKYADLEHGGTRTRKQAGVSLEEDHHIASKYRKENQAIFKRIGVSIDDDLNLITNFAEHGQLRGWYDWQKGGFKNFVMNGHNKQYNEWVTKLLKKAAPRGLPPDEALRRVTIVLERLKVLIRENPDILMDGPRLSPKFTNLKFDWSKP